MFVAAIRDPAGAIMNYVGVQVEVRRKTIKVNVKKKRTNLLKFLL